MCGFIGKISYENFDYENVVKCNNLIECRGPDSLNSYSGEKNSLKYHFVFNRLSILDLSSEANQPMVSNGGESLIMFNGEIYNHRELRKKLEKNNVRFFTNHSDTETILNGIDIEGVNFIDSLRGQFAIFYINFKQKKIIFARDRLGQKPLFVNFDNKNLSFGSNLISVAKLSNNTSMDEESIYEYLDCGIVSSPNTIFKNVKKLKPAEIIEVDISSDQFTYTSKNYWEIDKFVDNKPFDRNVFLDIFSEAVTLRTEADVEIANFISGGIDSSSIAKNLNDNNIDLNTFSVEIMDSKYDESKWSREVAEKYGTNHEAVQINKNIEDNDIFDSLNSLDEPYADPSIVPSYLLSKKIAAKYKVAISGDGGDELLGGYKRLNNAMKSKSFIQNLYSGLYSFYPPQLGTGANILSFSKDTGISFSSFLFDEKFMSLLNLESKRKAYAEGVNNANENKYKSLLISDYKLFLSEMMMLKVDRTSMANSLEVRSPFVDHKLIEYILSTKNSYFEIDRSKSLLKDYLLEDFNKDFVNREKMGFIFDLETWVYSNINKIEKYFYDGIIVQNFNKNILKNLSLKKSRLNANRIWRILTLEYYISNLDF